MDFSKLSETELRQFLLDHPDIPLRGGSAAEQATNLFNRLKNNPNQSYPETIVDLYLASLIQEKLTDTNKYTFEQIFSASNSSIQQFVTGLNLPTNSSRSRVYRILYYLGLIEEFSPESVLIQPLILEQICQNFTFDQAVNLQINSKLKNIPCDLKVDDRSGHILSLPGLTADTKYLNKEIFKHGSGAVIYRLIGSGYHPGKRSLPDRVRLLNILLPRYQADTKEELKADLNNMLLNSFDSDSEITETLLKFGADPNFEYDGGKRPLVDAVDLRGHYSIHQEDEEPRSIGETLTELLLKYGADPNFRLPDDDYGHGLSQNPTLLEYAIERSDWNRVPEILRKHGAH